MASESDFANRVEDLLFTSFGLLTRPALPGTAAGKTYQSTRFYTGWVMVSTGSAIISICLQCSSKHATMWMPVAPEWSH